MSLHAAQREAERFAQALRPGLMGSRLAVATGSGGPCHVLDAKFEPGVRGELLYEQGGHLVRGDLLPSDLAHETTPTGTSGAAERRLESPGTVVAPGVLLSPFPHDPDLPGLPAVMDPSRLGEALEALVSTPPGTRRRWQAHLLRYRPGKRATVLVSDGAAAAYVAKVYHHDRKAAAVAQEAPRLLASAPRGGQLAFAPVVGLVPELHMVVQHLVAGVPLDGLMGTRGTAAPGLPEGIRRAAQALAEFHALPMVSGRQRPVQAELHRFVERAGRIALVDSALGHAATDLAHRLAQVHERLPAPHLGTVHGDCKPSQFLLAPARVHLLDLDHCGVSDQAVDVGTFLATLRQLEIRHTMAGRLPAGTALFAACGDLFLREYLRCTGSTREPARIRWQEAVALERKALRAFARAPRSPLAGALILEAQHRLDDLKEAA